MIILTGRVERAYNITEQLPVWIPAQTVERFAEPTAMFYERSPWTITTIRSRLNTLSTLAKADESRAKLPLIVTSAYALMQKTLPVREFRAGSRPLRVGGRVELENLLRTLLHVGYSPASIVVEPGTFSRRGGILDVFPMSSDLPVRIEFFGDEIESMRVFNPATQRSSETIYQINITPAREEMPRFAPDAGRQLRSWFASQPQQEEDITSTLPDEEALLGGSAFPLIEFYLPYLYSYPANLLDYAPENTLIVIDDWGALQDSVTDLEEEALSVRQDKVVSQQLPLDFPLPYLTWDEIQDELSTRQTLHLGSNPEQPASDQAVVGDLFVPGDHYAGQLRLALDELQLLYEGGETDIVVTQQAQRLAELWSETGDYVHPITSITRPSEIAPLAFVEGALGEGWNLHAGSTSLHLLTDAELFGWKRPEPRRRQQPRALPPESSFADLEMGDYVVHIEYGIGRFAGLRKRTLDNSEREYLLVEYAGSDILYVPIHQADRLSRYVGADDTAPQLNRLGTQDWTRTKENTQRAVEEIARELLELYATREQVEGHAFSPDSPWQHELEASFPYVETDDQLRALTEVKSDMESHRPMDRLICGDVGYGKTEVALRAAFKAVMDGRQVAILVPTTVLAQQHFNTFSRRLLPFPVKVEMLSRFRSPAEQRQILYELAEGQVDIIIGTHRLLQPDVLVKNLGLLIIDEEQRFGVTHKERFKQMRTEVDVLTLTATPIPRTLYMSLTGIRDISMIQTAPEERLPIVTHVGVYNDKLVRQAILR
ncbi:MAG: DEAD/DEAH box helicase, partial [Chloroflexi bacterium]